MRRKLTKRKKIQCLKGRNKYILLGIPRGTKRESMTEEQDSFVRTCTFI